MRPLRIGVNALYLLPGVVGGTEIYLRSLLAALAEIDQDNQYVVFTNRETDSGLAPARANFAQAPQWVRASNRPWRILWEQLRLPRELRRTGCDVLLNPGFTAPVICPCPQVTVFHDLQHKRHPEFFRWFDLPFWRVLLWAAARRSRTIIAVSEATRQDFLRYYHADPESVLVVHHGVDPDIRTGDAVRAPYPLFLCVSTLHPHKNLDRLLRAFARFQAGEPRARLVIAGMRGFFAERLTHLAAELELEDYIRFTGWIPREQLCALYAQANAFVYPSRFEGFGMPVLEAMAAGLPVACSNIPVLREVAGDAALLFDPESETEIEGALRRLAFDQELRERLRLLGAEQAARFTWTSTARRTLAILRSAAQ